MIHEISYREDIIAWRDKTPCHVPRPFYVYLGPVALQKCMSVDNRTINFNTYLCHDAWMFSRNWLCVEDIKRPIVSKTLNVISGPKFNSTKTTRISDRQLQFIISCNWS
jgi:hypothetical protein